ncbi:MAG TPA: lytic transglycosylase domain-containing protein [Thermoanaerobaculia bacterium]
MRRLLLVAATLALASSAGRAEIALLANGRSLKVAAYEVTGDVARLTLAAGGHLERPIDRIERIVDDEVVPVPPAATALPERKWRFDEESRPLFGSAFDPIIVEAAKKFDVDAALVSAVIKAESDYDPRIVSRKGARGLMQLMPSTATRFGVTDSFDPHANIHGGVRYLRWLLDRFEGNAELALAGYNAGEGNVAKYEGVPPFRETVEYIRRIARYFERGRGVQLVTASM